MKTSLMLLLFVAPFLGISQIDEKIYLIIVSEDYINTPVLTRFKEFRKQDFTVQLVQGSDIGTTKDDFRDYIRNIMPSYVLLVGKYGDFPTHVFIQNSSAIESYNYYVTSSLTGHPTPDIPLGLFLVENETELENIINKTIYSENNISTYPKKFYAHAGSEEALPPWPVEFNEEILTEMNNKYFEPNGYNFTLSTANDSTPNDAWTDIAMINEGIQYMIYHGHGQIYKWKFGLGVGGVPQLNNTNYPFIFSFACLTGSFSGEIDGHTNACFAQKIVTSEHGAVAFLGAYHTSGRGMNLLLNGVSNALFNDGVNNRLGDVLLYGFANLINSQTVDQYYPIVTEAERTRTAWQFHLFGDPAIKVRENNTNSTSDLKCYDLKLYPNPTSEKFIIDSKLTSKNLDISIFSLAGKLVLIKKNKNRS